MSKSSKTSSTTNTSQNQTQHLVSTPTNPQWVTDSAQKMQGRINGLLDTDASTLVPGASALQTQAFGAAGNVGGWKAGSQTAQQAATGLLGSTLTPQQATSRSLLDVDLNGYMNPYLDSVLKTTLASNDEQTGMQRAQLAADQARGQKFSGSGSAIKSALFERGALSDRDALEASLRSSGYDKATGLATGDLNREADTSRFNAGQVNTMSAADRDAQLRAAGLLGDLSNTSAANDRADIGLLSDMGGQQREIDRQQKGADANLLSLVSALNGAQPYSLFHGQESDGNSSSTGTESTNSTTKESDPMGAIGGVLGGLGSLASGLGAMGATLGPLAVLSDERLKEDIKPEGHDAEGRPLVSYRYKGEPKSTRRFGHLAQDVEKTDPHAVRKVGKYKAIDYGLLGEAA